MNDRAKYKGRMAIYAMAGVYLLAQAYYMYKDIPTSSGTDKILMSIFMVVFAVIGAGMVIMGVTKSYKAIKEDYNAVPEEEKKDAETSEGEEAAVEAKEVAELEDKIEESKDAVPLRYQNRPPHRIRGCCAFDRARLRHLPLRG